CIKVPVSDKEYAAYIVFSYNVGSSGACRSTSFARLNRGDHRGACDALMNWVYAQGKVVKGLVNRRTAERKLCLEGVNELPSIALHSCHHRNHPGQSNPTSGKR